MKFRAASFSRAALLSIAASALACASSAACGDDSAVNPNNGGSDGSTDGTSATDGSAPKGDSQSPVDAFVQTDGTDANAYRDAGPPVIRYLGRFADGDGGLIGSWSGVSTLLNFSGSSAAVTIAEAPGGNALYDVIIDGVVSPDPITLMPGTTSTYPVASGLTGDAHSLVLLKRSEGKDGEETFLGFSLDEAGALLPPPFSSLHTIEFVGDSVTAGYGVLGTPPCTGVYSNTNVRLSYAGDTASTLAADSVFIAYSGKGVTRNYDHTDTTMLRDLYLDTNIFAETPAWDFSKFQPDAVVLALGENDYQPDNGVTPSAEDFQTAYSSFLQLLRSKNPNATIFATCTPGMEDPGFTTATGAISAAVTALADPKIFYAALPQSMPNDLSACQGHPGPAFHSIEAAALSSLIKQKMGW